MNRSSAATIAAASDSIGVGSISICGRGGLRSPLRPLIGAEV